MPAPTSTPRLRQPPHSGSPSKCSNGIAVPNPADNPDLVSDCATLLAAKDTLEGTSGNLNWSADVRISDWDGIPQGQNNNRVTELRLSKYRLNGAIPPELGNLANLEWLDLSDNQLTGAIPPELGNLANIEILWLGGNQLTGEIPPELGALANLSNLNLAYNQLTGAIPPELGRVALAFGGSVLGDLNLAGNQLTGEIPPELGNLIYLRSLHLHDNHLTGCIPTSLRQRSLEEIQQTGLPFCNAPTVALRSTTTPIPTPAATLAQYPLATPSPIEQCHTGTAVPNPFHNHGLVSDCTTLLREKDTLEGTTGNLNWSADVRISDWDGVTIVSNRVTSLELGEYRLNGAIPPELGNLPNLELLTLWDNQLTGEIPPELGNLANLETLGLWDNQLTGEIPPELGNLANLRLLSLASNQLTGEIPPELGNLANLKTLGLYDNQLTGEIPAELGNLPNLEWLYLSGNHLTGAIPSWLGDLTNLSVLGLSYNQLTGKIPAELGNLPNLESLYLSDNQLTRCIPASLHAPLGDDEIEKIGLPFCNDTTAAPTPIADWHTGQCSNGVAVPNPANNPGLVSDCAILLAAKDTLEGTSGNLEWSADVRISDWYGIVINNNRVSELQLEEYRLNGAIPPELGDLANLEVLALHGNQLTGEIPSELGNLANLSLLVLMGNQLTGEIPSWLGDLANLYGLWLDFNRLTGEIPPELGNLANLRSLGLSDNLLTGEIPSELSNLPNLNWARLSRNRLTGCIPASLRAPLGRDEIANIGLPLCG